MAQGRPQLKRPEDIPQEKPPEEKKPKKVKGPRAVGLLQLNSKGKATLIPIAILVDGKFHDASVYKADPVPMALDSGTIYEVEQTGDSQGLFTVSGALHSQSAGSANPWVGAGSFLPNGSEEAKKTRKAEDVPKGMDNGDNDAPPRLTRGNASKAGASNPSSSASPGSSSSSATPGGSSGTNSSAKPSATANSPGASSQPASSSSSPASGSGSAAQEKPAAAASDKPANGGTEQTPATPRQAGDGQTAAGQTSAGQASAGQASGGQSSGDQASGDQSSGDQASAGQAPQGQSGQGQSSQGPSSPGLSSPGLSSPGLSSPNQAAENYYRPTLRRGKPTRSAPDDDDEPAATGKAGPPGTAASTSAIPVRLLPAISDSGGPDPRAYKFFWKTGEEEEQRTQMLALAAQEVRAYANALAKNRIPANPPSTKASSAKRKSSTKPVEPVFEDVQFRAFDLWLNNQPVTILSAEAHLPPEPGTAVPAEVYTYSVTVAARTDIYGNLRKLYAGVTDKFHLDITPRLELIDAVDADGDGRGELLFRETTDAGNGYIIYRATPDKLWKMFDSLGE
jgi:hypothetical protein